MQVWNKVKLYNQGTQKESEKIDLLSVQTCLDLLGCQFVLFVILDFTLIHKNFILQLLFFCYDSK